MSNIEMHPVSSSNVAAVGHDEEENILAVNFLNGTTYHYFNVPKSVFDAMLTSESVGKYLNMVVKPQFDYTQVA